MAYKLRFPYCSHQWVDVEDKYRVRRHVELSLLIKNGCLIQQA